MRLARPTLFALALAAPSLANAIPAGVASNVEQLGPKLDAIYLHLHQNPELSLHEAETAAYLAEHLRKLGFTVTERVGGHGIVGILKNGAGPTVMLRTDLDGLPVLEKTGLAFASKRVSKDSDGGSVPVMHACAHDLHMTSWLGAAEILATTQATWRGTLMMVGQPAEEIGAGAKAMLSDGLFSRFKRPDFAIALHAHAELPAGQVALRAGYAMANVDSVDVTIFGRGGHGAYPHTTIDPILIAARTVVALQSIVSREIDPLKPAVLTVGSIQSGTKHNIIPDSAHLKLTVRSYEEEVRSTLLSGIRRIAEAEAKAANAPKVPAVTVSEGTPATYNDPALTERVRQSLRGGLGEKNVVEAEQKMGGEDFSQYGRAKVPAVLFWLGTVSSKKFDEAERKKTPLPSLHSPSFAPDRGPSIRTGVLSLTTIALDLMPVP